MPESKQPDQIRGPDENGMAEDGKEVTSEIEEVYDFDKEEKEKNKLPDKKENLPARKNKTISTEVLDLPKQCKYCYIQDKCQHFEEEEECYFSNKVSVQDAEDLVNIMKMLVETQSERVLFGRFIEKTEGGYMDKNLSEEMQQLTEMISEFKNLVSDTEEISIKMKGKNAVQQGGGILSQMFGGGNKDEATR